MAAEIVLAFVVARRDAAKSKKGIMQRRSDAEFLPDIRYLQFVMAALEAATQ